MEFCEKRVLLLKAILSWSLATPPIVYFKINPHFPTNVGVCKYANAGK